MSGLIDLADLVETVQIGAKSVPVRGVSAHGIAKLLNAFPEIRRLMAGAGGDFGVAEIIDLGPNVVVAVICEGVEVEADLAAQMPLAMQVDILEAMMRLTMPGGFGPFVERLVAIAGMPDAQFVTGRATS